MNNSYEFNKQVALFSGEAKQNSHQKVYRTVGLVIFIVTGGLCLARILMNFLPIMNDTLTDFIFSMIVQIGLLLVMPFLMYKYILKLSFKQVLTFSNLRKTKWYNYALSVPLGLCVVCITIGISSLWQGLIASLGYTHSTSVPLPDTFNVWLLITNICLTAILPGFCEEFTMRGGFLTSTRKAFSYKTTIVIMAVAFGLFHQSVVQVFYTMLMGGLGAFLTLKFKSVFPVMIVHFVNNFMSVFNEFCYKYGWLNGGFNNALEWTATYRPALIFVLYLVAGALAIGIIAFMLYLNSNKRLQKKKEVILDSAFNKTQGRVILMGEENPEMVKELGLEKEVYGKKIKEELYKPTLRDNAFYIGAIVVTVFSTIATFVFGFVV